MSINRKVLKIKNYLNCTQFSYFDLTLKDKSNQSSLFYKQIDKTNTLNNLESKRCSISRSISLIKDYVLSNSWDYFFTLTLKDDKRANSSWAVPYLIRKIKLYQKKCKDLKFIYVFERQKKGGIHIHGFFSGFNDLYINEYGHLASHYFDKIGFHCLDKVEKINPFYIIKYISKDDIDFTGHRFYRSSNLNKPSVSYVNCNFDELQNCNFTFSNCFCKMITVSN